MPSVKILRQPVTLCPKCVNPNGMLKEHFSFTQVMHEVHYLCFSNLFLPDCGGCGSEIKNGQSLVALDKHWHLTCFKCNACGKVLNAEYISK